MHPREKVYGKIDTEGVPFGHRNNKDIMGFSWNEANLQTEFQYSRTLKRKRRDLSCCGHVMHHVKLLEHNELFLSDQLFFRSTYRLMFKSSRTSFNKRTVISSGGPIFFLSASCFFSVSSFWSRSSSAFSSCGNNASRRLRTGTTIIGTRRSKGHTNPANLANLAERKESRSRSLFLSDVELSKITDENKMPVYFTF